MKDIDEKLAQLRRLLTEARRTNLRAFAFQMELRDRPQPEIDEYVEAGRAELQERDEQTIREVAAALAARFGETAHWRLEDDEPVCPSREAGRPTSLVERIPDVPGEAVNVCFSPIAEICSAKCRQGAARVAGHNDRICNFWSDPNRGGSFPPPSASRCLGRPGRCRGAPTRVGTEPGSGCVRASRAPRR